MATLQPEEVACHPSLGHSPPVPTGAAELGQRSASALHLEPGAWR